MIVLFLQSRTHQFSEIVEGMDWWQRTQSNGSHMHAETRGKQAGQRSAGEVETFSPP